MTMERDIPQVWNIFSVEGAYPDLRMPNRPTGGVHPFNMHYPHQIPNNWPVQASQQSNQVVQSRWADRNSACERPRTYDCFYERTPGNFHSSAILSNKSATDSAISLCSSEEDLCKNTSAAHRKVKRRSKGKRELQYSRTLTERDVKHLERHLSMKKTIRKKIMRDLQQAFVDDPRELAKPEKINMDVLNFDPKKKNHHKSEQRFLDVLRDGSSDDSGHGGSPRNGHKFRSVRERPKPRYPFLTDSSSCDDSSEVYQESIVKEMQRLELNVVSDNNCINEKKKKKKKKISFWKRLFGSRNKKKDKK